MSEQRFPSPPVLLSDEEPMAAGGWRGNPARWKKSE
jgi:hypothetical protein